MILQHTHCDVCLRHPECSEGPHPTGIRVPVAGYQCHQGYETSIQERLQPGDQLRLVREPNNPYDGDAVRVETLGRVQLGFIPRFCNGYLAMLLDMGIRIEAQVLWVDPSAATWEMVEIVYWLG